jgi:cell division septal protein FtsQ
MEQRYRPKRSSGSRTRFDVASAQRATRLHNQHTELPRVRKGLLVTLLFGVMVVLVVAWIMGDDFRIHDIQVENNQGVPVAQIIGASGLTGEHVLFADLNAAAKRVDDLPGVDAVRITCTWQGNCVILIQASQALAVWQGSVDSANKVWVDRQGKVQRALGDVPAKLNIRVEEGDIPAIGAPLDTNLLRALNELVALQPQMTRYSYSSQFGLMFTDAHGWKVRLGVAEHDGAMTEKLDIVKQLSEQLVAKKTAPHVIDVRFINAPYYVK